MRPLKKNQFTLIELMFVVAVLVILISISWVAGTKIIKEQINRKMQAEVFTLSKVIELYSIRYGSYPDSPAPAALNFGEKLSDVKPGAGWSGKRVMYIDFRKKGYKVSNNNYDDSNASATTVLDPYDNPYLYYFDSAKNKFYVWSVGADGKDDSSDDFFGSGDGNFGDDITSKSRF